MAKAYSLDMREKVVRSLQEQENPKKVAENFKIALATVYRWKTKVKTGKLEAQRRTNYVTKVSR